MLTSDVKREVFNKKLEVDNLTDITKDWLVSLLHESVDVGDHDQCQMEEDHFNPWERNKMKVPTKKLYFHV